MKFLLDAQTFINDISRGKQQKPLPDAVSQKRDSQFTSIAQTPNPLKPSPTRTLKRPTTSQPKGRPRTEASPTRRKNTHAVETRADVQPPMGTRIDGFDIANGLLEPEESCSDVDSWHAPLGLEFEGAEPPALSFKSVSGRNPFQNLAEAISEAKGAQCFLALSTLASASIETPQARSFLLTGGTIRALSKLISTTRPQPPNLRVRAAHILSILWTHPDLRLDLEIALPDLLSTLYSLVRSKVSAAHSTRQRQIAHSASQFRQSRLEGALKRRDSAPAGSRPRNLASPTDSASALELTPDLPYVSPDLPTIPGFESADYDTANLSALFSMITVTVGLACQSAPARRWTVRGKTAKETGAEVTQRRQHEKNKKRALPPHENTLGVGYVLTRGLALALDSWRTALTAQPREREGFSAALSPKSSYPSLLASKKRHGMRGSRFGRALTVAKATAEIRSLCLLAEATTRSQRVRATVAAEEPPAPPNLHATSFFDVRPSVPLPGQQTTRSTAQLLAFRPRIPDPRQMAQSNLLYGGEQSNADPLALDSFALGEVDPGRELVPLLVEALQVPELETKFWAVLALANLATQSRVEAMRRHKLVPALLTAMQWSSSGSSLSGDYLGLSNSIHLIVSQASAYASAESFGADEAEIMSAVSAGEPKLLICPFSLKPTPQGLKRGCCQLLARLFICSRGTISDFSNANGISILVQRALTPKSDPELPSAGEDEKTFIMRLTHQTKKQMGSYKMNDPDAVEAMSMFPAVGSTSEYAVYRSALNVATMEPSDFYLPSLFALYLACLGSAAACQQALRAGLFDAIFPFVKAIVRAWPEGRVSLSRLVTYMKRVSEQSSTQRGTLLTVRRDLSFKQISLARSSTRARSAEKGGDLSSTSALSQTPPTLLISTALLTLVLSCEPCRSPLRRHSLLSQLILNLKRTSDKELLVWTILALGNAAEDTQIASEIAQFEDGSGLDSLWSLMKRAAREEETNEEENDLKIEFDKNFGGVLKPLVQKKATRVSPTRTLQRHPSAAELTGADAHNVNHRSGTTTNENMFVIPWLLRRSQTGDEPSTTIPGDLAYRHTNVGTPGTTPVHARGDGSAGDKARAFSHRLPTLQEASTSVPTSISVVSPPNSSASHNKLARSPRTFPFFAATFRTLCALLKEEAVLGQARNYLEGIGVVTKHLILNAFCSKSQYSRALMLCGGGWEWRRQQEERDARRFGRLPRRSVGRANDLNSSAFSTDDMSNNVPKESTLFETSFGQSSEESVKSNWLEPPDESSWAVSNRGRAARPPPTVKELVRKTVFSIQITTRVPKKPQDSGQPEPKRSRLSNAVEPSSPRRTRLRVNSPQEMVARSKKIPRVPFDTTLQAWMLGLVAQLASNIEIGKVLTDLGAVPAVSHICVTAESELVRYFSSLSVAALAKIGANRTLFRKLGVVPAIVSFIVVRDVEGAFSSRPQGRSPTRGAPPSAAPARRPNELVPRRFVQSPDATPARPAEVPPRAAQSSPAKDRPDAMSGPNTQSEATVGHVFSAPNAAASDSTPVRTDGLLESAAPVIPQLPGETTRPAHPPGEKKKRRLEMAHVLSLVPKGKPSPRRFAQHRPHSVAGRPTSRPLASPRSPTLGPLLAKNEPEPLSPSSVRTPRFRSLLQQTRTIRKPLTLAIQPRPLRPRTSVNRRIAWKDFEPDDAAWIGVRRVSESSRPASSNFSPAQRAPAAEARAPQLSSAPAARASPAHAGRPATPPNTALRVGVMQTLSPDSDGEPSPPPEFVEAKRKQLRSRSLVSAFSQRPFLPIPPSLARRSASHNRAGAPARSASRSALLSDLSSFELGPQNSFIDMLLTTELNQKELMYLPFKPPRPPAQEFLRINRATVQALSVLSRSAKTSRILREVGAVKKLLRLIASPDSLLQELAAETLSNIRKHHIKSLEKRRARLG